MDYFLRLASSIARSMASMIQVETGRRSASASFLMVSRISAETHIRNGLSRAFLAIAPIRCNMGPLWTFVQGADGRVQEDPAAD
jgi:hypothetical protein